ncbi:MAG: LacI family transcriptional regulator [Candidatus Competibacteraceae bacterium]|nr:LacI family transcriptional regulator [Candidatus Competibacteraceae bacterium]
MQDVADLAGVSRMTVSYALKNDPRTKTATRQRVMDAAKTLNYQVNPLISALMSQRRNGAAVSEGLGILAVLVNRKLQDSTAEDKFMPGARERAFERGYRLEYFYLDPQGGDARKISRILYARGIQGVLIPRLGRSMVLDIHWPHFSVVAHGHTLVEPEFHRVVADLYRGALLAVEQLTAAGFRRIGLAIPALASSQTQDQWLAAMYVRQHAMKVRQRVRPLLLHWEDWQKTLIQWCRKEKPDVILHSHVQAEPVLKDAGIRVPQDMALAHLDQSMFTQEYGPGMAGIDQRWSAVSAAAIDVLVARIHANDRGIPEIPRTIQIEGRWVPGSSLGL